MYSLMPAQTASLLRMLVMSRVKYLNVIRLGLVIIKFNDLFLYGPIVVFMPTNL